MTQYSEIKMYGMTEDQIRSEYMESLTAKFSGLEMVVMSILSDCQEIVVGGSADTIRKKMNVAKFILCEMQDQKERV